MRGFVRSLHTPSDTGGSLSPRDATATPGPTGQQERSEPPSFLNLGLLPSQNWQGHHPGTATVPHIQARFQAPRVPAAAVSATSPLPPAQQTRAASDAQCPAGKHRNLSSFPESLSHTQREPARAGRGLGAPAEQGGRVSPAALPEPPPRPRWDCTDRHAGTGVPCSAPKTAKHHKEGRDPTGIRDTQGRLTRCSEPGRAGCRG